MLKLAGLYNNELKIMFANIALDNYYKFYFGTGYRDDYKPLDSTWNKLELVSVNNNIIIGYMSYSIDREAYYAYNLRIISFEKNSIIFAKDVINCIDDIFFKYRFNKLNFSIIIGNPIEKAYDKFINRYGGRIIGTYKHNTKLIDGKIYDQKYYEILKNEYKHKN